MTVRLTDPPKEILQRLDAIYDELLALRQAVRALTGEQDAESEDWVGALGGSLGPAAPDELDYFGTFDVSWHRFSE